MARDRELTHKEEQFAQAILRGERGVDAYAKLFPRASRKTATEKASRWARHDNIKARISELRAELQKASEEQTKEAAKAAVKQLTVALLTPARKYEILAMIAETSEDNREKMSAIKLDSELKGELVSRTDLTSDGEALPQVMPAINFTIPHAFPARRTANGNS